MKEKLNKGFTLVEVMVTLAILSIVTIMVGSFVIQGIRSYSRVNAEANLQTEAQMALNQIENMTIDATLGVNYGVVTDESGTPELVFTKKDSLVGGNLTNKILYVFNYNPDASIVDVFMVGYDADTKALYYKELAGSNGIANAQEDGSDDTEIKSLVDPDTISSWDLLALNVKDFQLDLSEYDPKNNMNKITIKLVCFRQNDESSEYETVGIINLRNDIEVNAEKISTIYERVTFSVKTIIDRIDLIAPPTTVRGQNYQLSTRVHASQGYPSQMIYKWTIEGVSGNNISTGTTITPDTKVLTIGNDETNTRIKACAFVDSGKDRTATYVPAENEEFEDDSDPHSKILVKACSEITVKNITGFTMYPDTQRSNITSTYENEFKHITYRMNAASQETAEINVDAGDSIYMVGEVSGDGSLSEEDGDTAIIWSLVIPQGSKVAASIGSSGLVTINNLSGSGNFEVVGKPRLAQGMELRYTVNVKNESVTSQTLTITGPDTLNRGATVNLGLILNKTTISASELSEFNWTKEVTSATSSSAQNAVTLSNNGVLTVADTLAFEYAYTVKVTASLKNDPDITYTKTITIPRVSVSVVPTSYYRAIGQTIDYDNIHAVVTGIENYDIDWSLASETNPNAYSTSDSHGSFISTDPSKKDSVFVSINKNEPSSLSYMRVKATIRGYANYNAVCRIILQPVSLAWSVKPQGTIARGQDKTFSVNATGAGAKDAYNADDVLWFIDKVVENNTEISSEGLTIEKGKLSVPLDYHYSRSNIDVYIHAEWAGQSVSSEKVTISSVGFNWGTSPSGTINRGGSKDYTVVMTQGTVNTAITEGVTWYIKSATIDGANTSVAGLTFVNGKFSVASDYNPSVKPIVVTLYAEWNGMKTDEKTVTIPKIDFSWKTAPSTVNRGAIAQYITQDGTTQLAADKVNWTIESVTGDPNATKDGLSFVGGLLIVDHDYCPTENDITVTLKAEIAYGSVSLPITTDVKIPGIQFTWKTAPNSVYRGESATFAVQANGNEVTDNVTYTINESQLSFAGNSLTIPAEYNIDGSDKVMHITATWAYSSTKNFVVEKDVTLPRVTLSVTSPSGTEIERGQNKQLNVTFSQGTHLLASPSDLTWSWDYVSNIDYPETGITLDNNGKFTVANNYYLSGSNIDVKVIASAGTVSNSIELRIKPINLTVSANKSTVSRGDSIAFSVNSGSYSFNLNNIEWEDVDGVLINLNKTGGTLTATINPTYNPQNTRTLFVVRAKVKVDGIDSTTDVRVNLNKVELKDFACSATSLTGGECSYTVTGLNNSVNKEVSLTSTSTGVTTNSGNKSFTYANNTPLQFNISGAVKVGSTQFATPATATVTVSKKINLVNPLTSRNINLDRTFGWEFNKFVISGYSYYYAAGYQTDNYDNATYYRIGDYRYKRNNDNGLATTWDKVPDTLPVYSVLANYQNKYFAKVTINGQTVWYEWDDSASKWKNDPVDTPYGFR